MAVNEMFLHGHKKKPGKNISSQIIQTTLVGLMVQLLIEEFFTVTFCLYVASFNLLLFRIFPTWRWPVSTPLYMHRVVIREKEKRLMTQSQFGTRRQRFLIRLHVDRNKKNFKIENGGENKKIIWQTFVASHQVTLIYNITKEECWIQ